MLRRIVGITGISLWAGLIVFAVVTGIQKQANGEQMFENLPPSWKVEQSFVAPADQTAAIGLKLGGKISKLTNTVLSIEGQNLQVNVFHCPTEKDTEKIYKAVLEAHNGLAVAAAQDGKLVIEFTKCDDVNLINRVRLAMGLSDARLDSIAGKLIKKIPDGWQIEKSFIASPDQTIDIGKKLGGQIKNLSNTIFSVQGQKFQVNIFECATPLAAEKIYNSILGMKGDPAFCQKYGNTVVEFVSGDVELAKKAPRELGFEPAPIETSAKDLVSALANGDYKKAVGNFDATMKDALPAEKLQEVWNALIAQSGPFVEQLGTRREKIQQYDVIFVTCKFENAALDAKVVFDGNEQIAGLFFVPSQEPIK
ncbi:MAG: DUF3887 domain-containing protein [Phycisphaerae bacterium]|jgi:hypothetical protein